MHTSLGLGDTYMQSAHTEHQCTMCDRLALCQTGQYPYLIHEFEHSIFVIGEHQYHRGYAQVILKQHVVELHELAPSLQAAHFQEVMTATRALVKTFQPSKMNHACYGNLDPHLHWHLFPRYTSDPHHQKQPWLHAADFPKHRIDEPTARTLAARVRVHLVLN